MKTYLKIHNKASWLTLSHHEARKNKKGNLAGEGEMKTYISTREQIKESARARATGASATSASAVHIHATTEVMKMMTRNRFELTYNIIMLLPCDPARRVVQTADFFRASIPEKLLGNEQRRTRRRI